MRASLERELATFERHRGELEARFDGRYALVHGDVLAGVHASAAEAADTARRRFGAAPCLVMPIRAAGRPAVAATMFI